ncbi:MAG: hypothetical protein SCI25_07180 [Desulfuromonadales bacterium]|nr:hypothetical protein [Desulfuromonadales bacterium]MDW7756155.1 hypothetical protein [Desulfuromonadales bacterium]
MVAKKKRTFDPFEEHREGKVNKRLRHVRTSLSILKNSKYNSMTKLAEAVAALVTEFELRDAGVNEKTDEIKGCDPSALIRSGSKYREAIQAGWEIRQGGSEKEGEGVSELESLKIRCANLAHHNDLLERRLEHKGLTALLEQPNAALEEKVKDIRALLDIINGVFGQVADLFTTVLEGDEDSEHPEAGLYGPHGLAVGIEALKRLKGAQDGQKD